MSKNIIIQGISSNGDLNIKVNGQEVEILTVAKPKPLDVTDFAAFQKQLEKEEADKKVLNSIIIIQDNGNS